MAYDSSEDNEILISIPYNENNILIESEDVERLLRNFDKCFLFDTYFLLVELFLIDQITEVSVLETGRRAKGPSFKKNCLAELLIIFL